ncbi:iron(III) transport system permease protein [Glaciihabitans tibetensis]|uniref:Iron(III) transport system permease protein n=1 Tax=Glaciihabitans tibetensis TaxID=1266600 RepID=A0A2T0VC12_9MICO|nr:iron ABC transporter permease [Glaciihabitans tibetensis]PRY67691.1 iron(III) transport system permease protein [Glaciihabitans tibetensis]
MSATRSNTLAGSADSGRTRKGVRPGQPEPGRRRPDGVTITRTLLWLACLALVVVPLGTVLALAAGGNHLALLLEGDVLEAGVNSLVSAVLSAAGAVVVGSALAILFDRTDLPGRRVFRLLALSPLLVPPFVGAIAWIGIAGPTSPVNLWWRDEFGGPLWIIYGGDGVVFLLIVHSYPIAMLVVSAALRRIPTDLEHAARIGGASALRALVNITLPLLRPALLSSFTLIAVSNLADFGIPSIIGLPERFVTLSTLVYRYIQSGTVDRPLEVVATIGAVLLVVALAALVLDLVASRRRWELDSSTSTPQRLPLGRGRVVVAVLTWTFVLTITVLPLLALLSQSLLPAPGVPLTLENLTLDNITRAVTARGTVTGATTSIMLATLAGLICGVLGLGIGTLVTRTKARDNRALHALAILPQAIPGLVIAVAWLVIAPRIGLFNTPWLILCAYITSFVALVVQAVAAPLSATPLTAEEAARASGATRLRALVDISCRMAIPAAVSGTVLVALTAVRELTLSVLLLSPGAQTLGVAIFNLQQAGSYNTASALSLIITIVGLAGLGFAARSPR